MIAHSERPAVVVDASVAVKWLVPAEHSAEAMRFLDPLILRHVPDLFYLEVAQTIWKKVHQRSQLTVVEGRSVLAVLSKFPCEVHPATRSLEGAAFDLAIASGRTVYDCTYLALARALGHPMVTADLKFFNATRGGPFADDIRWVTDPD